LNPDDYVIISIYISKNK